LLAVEASANLAIDMRTEVSHAQRMSVMIQIRNVPEALHRRLKARAALAGRSLSDYLLSEISEAAARPTIEELRERLAVREPVSPSPEPVMAVREERDTR
jgi:plasmid stability protein